MNNCEICGAEVATSNRLRICPKCLFAEALNEGKSDDTPADAPTARSSPLSERADFFGKYEVLEQVGQGGQGDVWKVQDLELRRPLAMKRLSEKHVSSEAVVYRFLAEAQIASQLEHPGILPIFDVGLDPDARPFYTTQLLPGTTLEDVWRSVQRGSGEWTLNRALELLIRVCEIVAHAHSHGVIHRDLKPSNILVGSFGDVRVIDWGSAYVLGHKRAKFNESIVELNRAVIQTDREQAMWGVASSPLSTAASGYPVTVVFMPPEALRGGDDQLGPETDIYSMGVMLYQLLSKRLPYSDNDGNLPEPSVLRALVMEKAPPPVRMLDNRISRDLAAICDKAMAREVSARYRAMPELADDLRAALETRPVQARKPGPWLRAQKWAARNARHVLMASLTLAVVVIGASLTIGLKAQRDAARQITKMRSADLATRSGQWRAALDDWAAAESAGYKDEVDLGLKRAEAWIILHDRAQASAEFKRLLARSDLGTQRHAVFLRAGEFEMFDRATFEQGMQRVREALAGGLDPADTALAHGLLAESTPESLAQFRRALEINPYFHSAHRHSLGLEFVLGRHDEMAAHLNVLRTLYPGEFSPGFIEMSALALDQKLDEAQARLAALTNKASPETLQRLQTGLRLLAHAADAYDVDVWLGERESRVSKTQLTAEAVTLLASRGATEITNSVSSGLPALPCVGQGIQEGFEGLKQLMLAPQADPEAALHKIKSGWKRHPEALFPVFAAMQLDRQQPRTGPRSPPLLATQAELYQMGADSPSIIPALSRLALVLAVDVQTALAASAHTNAAAARIDCLKNLRRASLFEKMSAAECRFYSRRAYDLGELDTARGFLVRWESLKPGDADAARNRIRLEMASGAYGPALKLLDRALAANPNDTLAKTQREQVVRKIKELNDEAQGANTPRSLR